MAGILETKTAAKEVPTWKRRLSLVEMTIGVISMILGLWVSILVFHEGYFMGALMLVVTGLVSVVLGWKEFKGYSGPNWQELFLKIVRRTFFFMNTMLSIVVAGTLVSMI